MHRSWRRPVLSLLAATALARDRAAAVAPPAQAADTDIKINEVESNGGTPGDWVELVNTGAARRRHHRAGVQGQRRHPPATRSRAGTTLAPGALLRRRDAEPFGFGLGAAGHGRLYAADGTTLVDTYSWTAHAATTYGRCPNGTGAFADDGQSTRARPTTVPRPPATS